LEEKHTMKKAIIFRRIAAMAILVATIGSCSGPTMKGYEGPGLPTTATAIIRSGAYTHIDRIDGLRVSPPYLNVSVPPGTYTIETAFVRQAIGNKLLYPTNTGSVTFLAEADHQYVVYAEAVPESAWMGVVVSTFNWVAYVTDENTGERIARTEPLPLKAEHILPPFYQYRTY
jgi:hypothetical protein